MTKEEQKAYIKKTWKISSGARIAEMLKRYWIKDIKTPEEPVATPESAKQIFNEQQ